MPPSSTLLPSHSWGTWGHLSPHLLCAPSKVLGRQVRGCSPGHAAGTEGPLCPAQAPSPGRLGKAPPKSREAPDGSREQRAAAPLAQSRRGARTGPPQGWHRAASGGSILGCNPERGRHQRQQPAEVPGTDGCSVGKPPRAWAGGRRQHPVVAALCHQVPLPKRSHRARCGKAKAFRGTPTPSRAGSAASLGACASPSAGPAPQPPSSPPLWSSAKSVK